MGRIRVLTAAVVAAGLLAAASPAHATLTLTQSSDSVVVVGDGSANRIHVSDGDTSPGNDYAFSFYSESHEPVDLGDSGCITDSGSPVENIYCGTSTFNRAVFNLGGGDDSLEHQGSPDFVVLKALTIDFGPGNDDNGSGMHNLAFVVRGGDGDDNLSGEDTPSSLVEGGPGADRLIGGEGNGETLRGGPGDDQIEGRGGNDQIFGDEGNDSLTGSQGGDTITGGPGQDNVEGDGVPNAFSGNDTLQLTDGERDVGVCGFGADTVVGDGIDLLPAQDCESVSLSGIGDPPPGVKDPGAAGGAKVALAKPGKVSVRKRKLSLRVSCPASANGRCAGRVAFTARFRERGRKRTLSLGRVSFTLTPGASKTVSRKLSKRVVRRLRRATKRRLTVRATSRDAAGTSFTSSRTAALKLGR